MISVKWQLMLCRYTTCLPVNRQHILNHLYSGRAVVIDLDYFNITYYYYFFDPSTQFPGKKNYAIIIIIIIIINHDSNARFAQTGLFEANWQHRQLIYMSPVDRSNLWFTLPVNVKHEYTDTHYQKMKSTLIFQVSQWTYQFYKQAFFAIFACSSDCNKT